MHATEYLKRRPPLESRALVVLHGGERHLKQTVIERLRELWLGAGTDEELGLARISGKTSDLRTVKDELQLVSMFSTRKLVLVEDADDFVTEHRAALEQYADNPSKKSLLVLELKTWRKNTRLAKKTADDGLEIDCGELAGAPLRNWLMQQAQDEHGKQLSREAADLMMTLAGTNLSLLDQELGKLAAYVGEGGKIGVEEVRTLVGGWKTQTTWAMIDAVRDGRHGVALQCLHQLLYAGEPAAKILGGVNFVFRKIAQAVEQSRSGGAVRDALKDAGVFPKDIAAAESYLRRMTRPRAERMLETLAWADYRLKGGSRLPEQMQLEQLLLWLGGVGPDLPQRAL